MPIEHCDMGERERMTQCQTEWEKELELIKSKLSEALDRQAATNEILQVIANSPADTQPVFEAIVRTGTKLFPDAAISVALPQGDQVQAAAVADADPARAESWRQRFPFPLTPDYMHSFVILEGQIIDIPDVEDAPSEFAAGAQNFLASGYRGVTMMPMMRGDAAIGALSVVRLAPGPLSSEQFSALQIFAAQAVIAVENTRMVNEMRQTNKVLETVSDQLAKYISPQLYQSIVSGEQRVAIGSKRKKLTIFFSDIANFTEISDQLEPEELTSLLNEYLTEMSKIALKYGAYFDKFVGDAMMFYFGDPESNGVREDASACVRMAMNMQRRLRQLQMGWQQQGLIDRPIEARIGINTGYCTVGNFGSEDRMDYTAIGGEVNLTARLEAHAEFGGILLAAETYALVKDWLQAVEQEAINMKGFPKPIRTFSVQGIYDELPLEASMFRHEDEGVTITINSNRADKAKTREILELALAHLDDRENGE
jgi:class 3 adenylate cyclase